MKCTPLTDYLLIYLHNHRTKSILRGKAYHCAMAVTKWNTILLQELFQYLFLNQKHDRWLNNWRAINTFFISSEVSVWCMKVLYRYCVGMDLFEMFACCRQQMMMMTGVFVSKWENINLPSLQENMHLPCKMKAKLFHNKLQLEQNSLSSHTIFTIMTPNIIHQLVTILYRNRQ